MPTSDSPKWSLEAEYLQSCNCDYGCPCEFEAPPTMGYCEGTGSYRITRGKFGDLSLDGISFAFVIKMPGAMHRGNGTLLRFFDAKASPEQQRALDLITSGRAGGMPFEAFTMIITNWPKPVIAPFTFTFNGLHSSVKIGEAINVQTEPIKNPVTGEDESIRIEHGTGFIFKGADCVSAKENRVNSADLSFNHPDKAGFVTKVRYGN